MESKSVNEKGKEFENLVAGIIRSEGFGLARREAGSGSGKRKGDIAANIPFLLEAKNHKKIKIQEWIRQAKEQARIGNYDQDKWGVVFRDPETPEANPSVYITIDFYQFLILLKKDSEPRIKEPDREMKWHLVNLKNAINQVIKDLNY